MSPKEHAGMGKATKKKSDKQRCLEFLQARKGEEYTPKAVSSILKVEYHSVRKALRRLFDEKEYGIEVIQKGIVSFYKIPSVSQVEDYVDEMERQLVKQIALEKEPRILSLHNVELYIKRGHCDKTNATLSDRLKECFNAISPTSLYGRWREAETEQIRGGFQERFEYKGRQVVVQVFGTGGMNIYLNASEHPLPISEWPLFEEWLEGLLFARSGYGFNELKELTTVCWEWNVDTPLQSEDTPTEEIIGTGKFAITVKMFDDMVARIYLKHFKDGRVALREEQAVIQAQTYPEFLKSSLVMQMGGVSQQWMVRQQFEQGQKLERTLTVIEGMINESRFNRAMSSKIEKEIEELRDTMKKMAKSLGIDDGKQETNNS